MGRGGRRAGARPGELIFKIWFHVILRTGLKFKTRLEGKNRRKFHCHTSADEREGSAAPGRGVKLVARFHGLRQGPLAHPGNSVSRSTAPKAVRRWMRPRSSSCLPSVNSMASSASLATVCRNLPLAMFQLALSSSAFITCLAMVSHPLRLPLQVSCRGFEAASRGKFHLFSGNVVIRIFFGAIILCKTQLRFYRHCILQCSQPRLRRERAAFAVERHRPHCGTSLAWDMGDFMSCEF